MKRSSFISEISGSDKIWDVVVIGGGATGLGIAVDAASRGYRTALFEQSDFAKATSSRSTKLVHGGVRYLQQGDVALVLEALHERGLLKRNAPHLVHDQKFIIPAYRSWEKLFYGIGLTMYDLLAGRLSLGRSLIKKQSSVEKAIPMLRKNGLKGGVLYHDGQFDDSRLAINLARTASDYGAVVLNYFKVNSLIKENGLVAGVNVRDEISGMDYSVKAKAVVNATGVFVDDILIMDNPSARHIVKPSQGIHLVLDREFLGGDTAIMIPKTDDGRVLFAVPWHDKVVVGTTDTLMDNHSQEPRALESEIEFVLNTAGRYLTRAPQRSDVRSVFAGLRPLAAPSREGKSTKEISRSHKIMTSPSKLVTIIGGKWTTYRRMAEDTVDKLIAMGLVADSPCVSESLHIHGYMRDVDMKQHDYFYGSDKDLVDALTIENHAWDRPLGEGCQIKEKEVVWAVREEMAQKVEDFLARRTRLLLLDARKSQQVARRVAEIMASQLGYDNSWVESQVAEYQKLSDGYILK